MIRGSPRDVPLFDTGVAQLDPVAKGEPVQRGDRATGVIAVTRCMGGEPIRKRLKSFSMRPFVEVSGDNGRSSAGCFTGQDTKLATPIASQKPKVRGHYAQSTTNLQIDQHRATRLGPGKINPGHFGNAERVAHKDRVAMPAKAGPVVGHFDKREIGFCLDHAARKRRRSCAQTPVGLLKHHDIRTQIIDHLQCPFGAAALIQPACLANVIACYA